MIRKIVRIDEEKCDGCGLCVPSCAEGAITIVEGKAKLAADNLCDGLGACLGECPKDAILIIEREADEFDEEAVHNHHHSVRPDHPTTPLQHNQGQHSGGGCTGTQVMAIERPRDEKISPENVTREPSSLAQWPIQLHLVPPGAPFFQDADLIITADCVPFAYAGFHRDFLAGNAVVIGCPKLDDNRAYLEKLTGIFRTSSIRSITILRMEVPCCGGIVMAAKQAVTASGKDIPFREVTIGINGEIR